SPGRRSRRVRCPRPRGPTCRPGRARCPPVCGGAGVRGSWRGWWPSRRGRGLWGVRGPGPGRRARLRTALRRREQRGWCRACSFGVWSLGLRGAAAARRRSRGGAGGLGAFGRAATFGGFALGFPRFLSFLGFRFLGFATRAGARGFCVGRRRARVLFAVFAVVGDVETRPFEQQTCAAGDLARGEFPADRASELGRGCRDGAEELVERVSVRADEFVSGHVRGT